MWNDGCEDEDDDEDGRKSARHSGQVYVCDLHELRAGITVRTDP